MARHAFCQPCSVPADHDLLQAGIYLEPPPSSVLLLSVSIHGWACILANMASQTVFMQTMFCCRLAYTLNYRLQIFCKTLRGLLRHPPMLSLQTLTCHFVTGSLLLALNAALSRLATPATSTTLPPMLLIMPVATMHQHIWCVFCIWTCNCLWVDCAPVCSCAHSVLVCKMYMCCTLLQMAQCHLLYNSYMLLQNSSPDLHHVVALSAVIATWPNLGYPLQTSMFPVTGVFSMSDCLPYSCPQLCSRLHVLWSWFMCGAMHY